MPTTLVDRKPDTASHAAHARWATVRIETDTATYVGRIYVPETKRRLSDVLCDDRLFLSLTEVSVNEADNIEPFVALNKHFVRTIRVLHEDEVHPSTIRFHVS